MKTLLVHTIWWTSTTSAHKHWKEMSQLNARRKGVQHVSVVGSYPPDRRLITFDAEIVAFLLPYRLHLWRIDKRHHRSPAARVKYTLTRKLR
ncbi:hypothetical protein ARMGADRAFT_778244 [Armillaria gallica]|uniref:Uncharacterized protein n=1 Tax=Armillaria gallica TaxID=47427 RepID=A0A2H3CXH6_ARMGA|nr:hypothetical protein ARMGADRAFT_778244 [Armillaria gallica]